MKRTRASIGLALAVSFGVAPVATTLVASTAQAATASIDRYTGVTSANLNVRSGPGTQYAKAGLMPAGTPVDGYVPATGWIKLVSGPYAGKYVSRSYVKVTSVKKVTWADLTQVSETPPPSPPPSSSASGPVQTFYAPQTTNIRWDQSVSKAPVGTVPTGTIITGRMDEGNWLRIITPSQYAGRYISTSVLTPSKPPVTTPKPTVNTDITEAVFARAKSKEGAPYVWGAQGPNSFDCSGLVRWAYNTTTGKNLVQGSFNQINAPQVKIKVSKTSINNAAKLAGMHDLVFFHEANGRVGHVGWATGGNNFYSATFYGGEKATTTTYTNYAQHYAYVTIADWK